MVHSAPFEQRGEIPVTQECRSIQRQRRCATGEEPLLARGVKTKVVSVTREEHEYLCPYEGVVEPQDCQWCERSSAPVWFTPNGHAYHVNPKCPSLHGLRQQEVKRSTVGRVGGGRQGCHQCVNHICSACATGDHDNCNPRRSHLDVCECKDCR